MEKPKTRWSRKYQNSEAQNHLGDRYQWPFNEHYECVTCKKEFTTPSGLKLHMNTHAIERRYKCEPCGVSFMSKGHLQKHIRSAAHDAKVSIGQAYGTPTSDNPRPFNCTTCDRGFRILGHLQKHLRSKMHLMKVAESGNGDEAAASLDLQSAAAAASANTQNNSNNSNDSNNSSINDDDDDNGLNMSDGQDIDIVGDMSDDQSSNHSDGPLELTTKPSRASITSTAPSASPLPLTATNPLHHLIQNTNCNQNNNNQINNLQHLQQHLANAAHQQRSDNNGNFIVSHSNHLHLHNLHRPQW